MSGLVIGMLMFNERAPDTTNVLARNRNIRAV